ncbi:MAG: acetamidase/formamidase family protein [Frankia sp.]
MALQPGKGKVDGKHYLPSTPETVLWGRLPGADTRPVLTVDPGVTLTMDTVSQEGMLEDQGRDPEAFFGRYGVAPSEVLADARSIAASGIPHRFGTDGPHILTGPVHVRGAEPGDVLRVEVLSLHPRARYGVVSNRHGAGLLAGEFPEAEPAGHADADARHWQRFGTVTTFCQVERRRGKLLGSMPAPDGRKVRFPLAPFMGIMAVGLPGPDPVDSAVAGRYGGNLACRELVAGSRLYLPVALPGALFAVGNPRYAQGNGMVAHTALEAPLRATFRLTLLSDRGVGSAVTACIRAAGGPFGETDTHWIPMGAHPDLTEAFRQATRAAVGFLTMRIGLSRADALAYLSSAADFSVSQLVDEVQTVHCLLRRADFGEPPLPKTRLSRPGFTRSASSHETASGTGEGESEPAASDRADSHLADPEPALIASATTEAPAPSAGSGVTGSDTAGTDTAGTDADRTDTVGTRADGDGADGDETAGASTDAGAESTRTEPLGNDGKPSSNGPVIGTTPPVAGQPGGKVTATRKSGVNAPRPSRGTRTVMPTAPSARRPAASESAADSDPVARDG